MKLPFLSALGVLASASAYPPGIKDTSLLSPEATHLTSNPPDPASYLPPQESNLSSIDLLLNDLQDSTPVDESSRLCPRFGIQDVASIKATHSPYSTPFHVACDVDIQGNDVSHSVETVYGAKACAVMCHHTPGCHASVFYPQPELGGPGGGTCHSKSRVRGGQASLVERGDAGSDVVDQEAISGDVGTERKEPESLSSDIAASLESKPGYAFTSIPSTDGEPTPVVSSDAVPDPVSTTAGDTPTEDVSSDTQVPGPLESRVAAFLEENPGYALTWIPSTHVEPISSVEEFPKETERASTEISHDEQFEGLDDDLEKDVFEEDEEGEDTPLLDAHSPSENAPEEVEVRTIFLTTSLDFTVVVTRTKTAASSVPSSSATVSQAMAIGSHQLDAAPYSDFFSSHPTPSQTSIFDHDERNTNSAWSTTESREQGYQTQTPSAMETSYSVKPSATSTAPRVTSTHTASATPLPTVTVFVPANAFSHGTPAPKVVACKPGWRQGKKKVNCEAHPSVVLEYVVMQQVGHTPSSTSMPGPNTTSWVVGGPAPSVTAESAASAMGEQGDNMMSSVDDVKSFTTLAPSLYTEHVAPEAPHIDASGKSVTTAQELSPGAPGMTLLPGPPGPPYNTKSAISPPSPSSPTSKVHPDTTHPTTTSALASLSSSIPATIATPEPTYVPGKSWTAPGDEQTSKTRAPKPSATPGQYLFEGGALNVSPAWCSLVVLVWVIAGAVVVV